MTSEIGDIDSLAHNLINILINKKDRVKLGLEARESFDELKRYDINEVWRDIISICSGEQCKLHDNYFTVHDSFINNYQFIEPILIEKVLEGYDGITESKNYKVGEILLRYPRLIKKHIKAIL